jgi:hypothetical protein
MAKIKLAKHADNETVESLRHKQVDIIAKWVASQNKPPAGLVELETQKEALKEKIDKK